jgi:hypothetical protein
VDGSYAYSEFSILQISVPKSKTSIAVGVLLISSIEKLNKC